MSREMNRRAVLAGAAAIAPAAALAAAPALAEPDAELIKMGRQLEQAVVASFEAMCDWAPRLCEAKRKVHERLGNGPPAELLGDIGSPQRELHDAVFGEAAKSNNLDEASDRINTADDLAGQLVDRIAELEAETIEGLRTKALAVLFEMKPISADEPNSWQWPDDGGTTYSLFYNVAHLTGLLPLVEHYEARFDRVAEEIELAGGKGEIADEGSTGPLTPEKLRERAKFHADEAKVWEAAAEAAEAAS